MYSDSVKPLKSGHSKIRTPYFPLQRELQCNKSDRVPQCSVTPFDV